MVFGTSVSKWIALTALIALLWVARGVLPPFIVAGILAYVLSPLVDELAARTRLRRAWVALAVFLVVLLVVGGLAWFAGARLNAELRALEREGPSIIESVVDKLTGGQTIDLLGQNMTSRELGRRLDAALHDALGTPSQAIQAITVGFELTLAVVLVFLSLAYMLVDGQSFFQYVLGYVPAEHRLQARRLSTEIHRVLGRYLRGQLFLIGLMSVVTFSMLEWFFHLPYALWVAILTGVLEIIPLIGPITAGAIACTIGFAQGGPPEAAGLAIVYLILRQVEDQLVMPIVVGRAVHVHPLVTIFAVLTGERVGGVLGMILAVPIAAAVKVVLDQAYPPGGQPPHIELPGQAAEGQAEIVTPPAQPSSPRVLTR
ncbi:MAG TPA: AI-2E family transporter [Chloroflexota bacterium]